MSLAAPMLSHTAALPASTVFYSVASCHPFPVLVQGESVGLPVMSVPARVYCSLPGGVHTQGRAALCEVSLRQGHKKLCVLAAVDQHGRRAGSTSRCDECEGC